MKLLILGKPINKTKRFVKGLPKMSINTEYYRITITNFGQVPNGTGFIDPKEPEYYLTLGSDFVFSNLPDSLSKSLEKSRANHRWKQLLSQLSISVSPTAYLDIQTPNADINNPPTEISFTVVYDRPSALVTDDELNPGQQLVGELAIKRWIGRALTRDYTTNLCILDPTPLSAPAKAGPASAFRGETITQVIVGALSSSLTVAATNITVVKLANT